jgi:hypothetical protein
MAAEELVEKDVDLVIVTPQFLESQYGNRALHDDFQTLIATEGYDAACKKHPLGRERAQRVKLSLYSSTYANRLLPFTHVIVDDAQYGKNTEGSTHKALRRLYARIVFQRRLLLSATPLIVTSGIAKMVQGKLSRRLWRTGLITAGTTRELLESQDQPRENQRDEQHPSLLGP